MKKLSAKMFTIVLLFAACGLLLVPSPAKAGADVITGTCDTITPVGEYFGHFSTVATPSGRINAHCNAFLINGPGTDKTIHTSGTGDFGHGVIPCDFVINPGGRANAECHN